MTGVKAGSGEWQYLAKISLGIFLVTPLLLGLNCIVAICMD
ncbi:hypothetical protein SPLC1_S202080 [Arthrospira platensis C1]|nr:hypothetical protein SPLC1_S202080 [Arthrospira platensis C1]